MPFRIDLNGPADPYYTEAEFEADGIMIRDRHMLDDDMILRPTPVHYIYKILAFFLRWLVWPPYFQLQSCEWEKLTKRV